MVTAGQDGVVIDWRVGVAGQLEMLRSCGDIKGHPVCCLQVLAGHCEAPYLFYLASLASVVLALVIVTIVLLSKVEFYFASLQVAACTLQVL